MPDSPDFTELPPLPEGLAEKIRQLRLLVLDVDGTLTDGRIIYGEHGEQKHFHALDGAGIKFLLQGGVQVAWISSRRSELVERRAAELGLQHVIQGASGKGLEIERIQARLQIAPAETAAMGDDLPDLAMFSRSAVTFAPADAVPDILMAADWITPRRAGHGAVREVAELILKVQGAWDFIVAKFACE